MTHPSNEGAKTPARSKSQSISKLNTDLRTTASFPNTYLTLELANRGMPFVRKVLAAVKGWKVPDDPDETDLERSWGTVTIDNVDVSWSIDYYELNGEEPAADPSIESDTLRTMTLERA